VLNAFRHQRNDHFHSAVLKITRKLCSTPSGIKGTITEIASNDERYDIRCSTPSGIKGTITTAMLFGTV